jgi:hypothetical protein
VELQTRIEKLQPQVDYRFDDEPDQPDADEMDQGQEPQKQIDADRFLLFNGPDVCGFGDDYSRPSVSVRTPSWNRKISPRPS